MKVFWALNWFAAVRIVSKYPGEEHFLPLFITNIVHLSDLGDR
jgi:hypothetical protein